MNQTDYSLAFYAVMIFYAVVLLALVVGALLAARTINRISDAANAVEKEKDYEGERCGEVWFPVDDY